MTDYLYPGVYLTEIESGAKPIEGVSTSTAKLVGGDVIAKFQQLVQHRPSDGTQHNASDPGIALLELFAWLTEMLVYRVEHMPERGVLHAARLAAAALALVKDREQPHGSVLKGVDFFDRQLLNDDDLRVEVDYTRRQVDATSHAIHHVGIVCGLEISISSHGGRPALNVTPGLALDEEGRDVVLAEQIALPLPSALESALVIARRKCRLPTSIVLHPSVVCEFLVVNEPQKDDFALGRVEKTSDGWRVARTPAC